MALVPAVTVPVLLVPLGAVTAMTWLPLLVVVANVQVMDVLLLTVNALQAVPPTVTAVAPVKAVPVIATVLVVLAVPMVELGHSPLALTV